MIKVRITLTGTAPLLMHNARLSNPLDPATKALKRYTSKRTKTDEDHENVARLEHAGSLYIDSDVGPYVPGDNVFRSLWDGAKKHKLGVKVKEGVLVTTDVNPLAYQGPRDVEGLWAAESFRLMASVKVGTQRVMRCRPLFREWSTEVDAILDPNVIDIAEIEQVAETAGTLIGLGDWRPRYGRYNVSLEKL